MTIRVKTLFKGILFHMRGHEIEVYTFNCLHTAVICTCFVLSSADKLY